MGDSIDELVTETRPKRRPTYLVARWLFLRLLGLVFLVAALSLWSQVHGLVGDGGIVPVRDHLAQAKLHLGDDAYRQLPTFCWIHAGDLSLSVQCGVLVVASLLLIAGVLPGPMLAVLWTTYLSMMVAGQLFLGFQWDSLLLETAVLSMLVAPWRLRSRVTRDTPPAASGLWVLRWLVFKLMFLSGVTKLLSGDPTWRDLTALDHHYQTQPLPTWIGWHAHHLPDWFQQTSVIGMYAIELGVPLLVFAPARWRRVGGLLLIAFQVLIAVSGNYCFFNLLTIALCVLLLDDAFLRRLAPSRWTTWIDEAGGRRRSRPALITGWVLAGLLMVPGVLVFAREITRTAHGAPLPPTVSWWCARTHDALVEPGQRLVLRWTDPTRSINGYGLFRVMTTHRPEIVIEGSEDGGRTWHAYELPHKPGDPSRRPTFVAPHQPRLDWQLWFAALQPRGHGYWLQRLTGRLLEADPSVLALFETDPFDGRAPHYVRLVFYEYEFTDPETRARTGDWWQRRRLMVTDPIRRPPEAAPGSPAL